MRGFVRFALIAAMGNRCRRFAVPSATSPRLSARPSTRAFWGRGLKGSPWGCPVAFDRIVVDPSRMAGVPSIRDTRVTVFTVLGQLVAGRTAHELMADYPYLELGDVAAALKHPAALANER